MASDNLPSNNDKPSLLEWLEGFLPFKFPRIPLAQTAKNLDKAAAAIALAAGDNAVARIQASTGRIAARTDAERLFIQYGADQIPTIGGGIEERAIQYALSDALSKQRNREKILELSAAQLETEARNEDAAYEIDDDWLNEFRRYAETKSKADAQYLWGRILTTEIKKPGSVSLRTLDFLSKTSAEDAKKIVKIFTFTINGAFIPQFIHSIQRIQFGEYLALESLGILSGGYGVGGTGFKSKLRPMPTSYGKLSLALTYFSQAALFHSDDENYAIEFQSGVLTDIGLSIFQIADTKVPDYPFFEDFVKSLAKPPVKAITLWDVVTSEDRIVGQSNERVLFKAAT